MAWIFVGAAPAPQPTHHPTARPTRHPTRHPTHRPSHAARPVAALTTTAAAAKSGFRGVVVVAGMPFSGADEVVMVLRDRKKSTPVTDWDLAKELLSSPRLDRVIRVPGALPQDIKTGGEMLASLARGALRAPRMVIVLRHPMSWSIAYSEQGGTTAQGKILTGVSFWLETAASLIEGCEGCAIVQAEMLHDQNVRNELLGSHGFELNDVFSKIFDGAGAPFDQLTANLDCVHCWLRGRWWTTEGRCQLRDEFAEATDMSTEKHLEFWAIKKQFECTMNRFGYSMRCFEQLLACVRDCDRAMTHAHQARALTLDLATPAFASRVVRGAAVLNASSWKRNKGDVIVAFFKLYNNAKGGARGGMFMRMAQVVRAISDAGFTVHFICHCDVVPPLSSLDTSWAPRGTRFYPGSMQQQLDQMLPYSCQTGSVKALFLFVTSLTVDMHYRAVVKKAAFWWKEPKMGEIDSEVVYRRVSDHSPGVRRVVLTDDIHHVRALEAFRDVSEPLHISYMIAWLKRREMRIYLQADEVLTVSQEDAEYISNELQWRDDPDAFVISKAPQIQWAPFIQTTVLANTVSNFDQRSKVRLPGNRTALVYVGMPHPLAIPAVKWLVRLLPRLAEVLEHEHKMSTEFVDANVLLYLVGGGLQAKRWKTVTREAPAAASRRVRLIGAVSDAAVGAHLSHDRRLFVAPLFNNTGIATKVVNAMSHGLPVVTTSGGCRGLGLLNATASDALLVADDEEAFVRQMARGLVDDALWSKLSSKSIQHVEDHLSRDSLTNVVRRSILDADAGTASLISGHLAARDERTLDHRDAGPPQRRTFVPTLRLKSAVEASVEDGISKLCATRWFTHVGEPSLVGNFFAARRFRPPTSPSSAVMQSELVAGVVGESCLALDWGSLQAGWRPTALRPCKKAKSAVLDEPRMFEWKGAFWVIFAAPPYCFVGVPKCGWCRNHVMQYLVKLDFTTPTVFSDRVLPIHIDGAPLGLTQRAFTPFVRQGELFAAATLEPHLVMHVNISADHQGHSIAAAAPVAITSNDKLFRDLRQLDGGCPTRPPLLGSTVGVLRGSEFVAVLRTLIERDCVRFYEHYAYTYSAEPPFRVLRRSRLPLPLSVRSFSIAKASECRLAESWRVRTSRAKFVSGIEVQNGGRTLVLSYSAGARYAATSIKFDFDDLELIEEPPLLVDILQECPTTQKRAAPKQALECDVLQRSCGNPK
mmetsp:Transcript_8235/g.27069  ORF Transcript_8235/g.27069 Transcript_8235/m.27069 type:complete len:1211 (+) Transcript_8235:894-4526(+)